MAPDTAIALGIIAPNSSGMGRHPDGPTAGPCAVLVSAGYSYSHSVGVWHPGADFATLYHVWRSPLVDHAVSVYRRHDCQRWRMEGSHGGSGTYHALHTEDALRRYLAGVNRRARAKVTARMAADGQAWYVVRVEDSGSASRSAPWQPIAGPFARRADAVAQLPSIARLYGPGTFDAVLHSKAAP